MEEYCESERSAYFTTQERLYSWGKMVMGETRAIVDTQFVYKGT